MGLLGYFKNWKVNLMLYIFIFKNIYLYIFNMIWGDILIVWFFFEWL